ncbi:MAG TPA: DUF4112 domain-containing protein [Sphingomicrobium sp.]|nr:DUF4112 domain-containing protein [Sphingomicrobium sp.]
MIEAENEPRPGSPLGSDPHSVRRRVETMERLLERLITVPGLNRPVGLDAILSLIPLVGTTAGAALGAYMLWEARNLEMSKWQMARMSANTGFDWLLGLVPLVGAIPDFFFRSNTRNLRIIKRHLDRKHPSIVTVEAEASKVEHP